MPEPDSLVMMTARARFPRVVHKLAQVKDGVVLYPYVMACGYATTSVQEPLDEARKCGRCWPESEAGTPLFFGRNRNDTAVVTPVERRDP